MSQEKKIQQIEQLIQDASLFLIKLKEYEKESKKLDALMANFLNYQKQEPLFTNEHHFKLLGVKEDKDNILSFNAHTYQLSFELKKPPMKKFSGYGYSMLDISKASYYYQELEHYKEQVKQVRKEMAETFMPFEKFIISNYHVEIESKSKKIIATTQNFTKVYFLKDFDYALVYQMDFDEKKLAISLQPKDEPQVVKQFDKNLLNSYLEKTKLEAVIQTDENVNSKQHKKTVKI
jgi:hypothetical protein